jgi:iron complex outermembrane receptor protein
MELKFLGLKFPGLKFSLSGASLALSALIAPSAAAQQAITLPQIEVTASRTAGAVTGSSTTVITAADIARSPSQSLPDILSEAAGVTVLHSTAGPAGVNDLVDLRGFGAFAQSNVLVLVNGRRYQDFDLQGFDYSIIPLNSIERIEITRGNSGAVLYGDGAVGGVINIVTKSSPQGAFSTRVEGIGGSYGYGQSRVSAAGASGPWSVSLFGNAITSDGYRDNSDLRQGNFLGTLKYKSLGWSSYLTVAVDDQRQNLPGALPNLTLVYPITLATPQASVTPFDWSKKKDFNATGGFTRTLDNGAELIVDGGIRRKYQQSLFYNYFNNPGFVYDPSTAVPANFVDTVMTTASFTPRIDWTHRLFGAPGRLLTGFDFYNTQYNSDREQDEGLPPFHRYDIRQTTAALYAMNTSNILPQLDISFGGRLQYNLIKGTDDYNAASDPNAGFYATNPQAPPVDRDEWQYAAHLGYEYRATPVVTVFGRVARAFRLPNADERVGAGNPFDVVLPASLDLKTQTSFDVENGVRLKFDGFAFESTAYLMRLDNEIHFIPALFANINLDPTQRIGWENTASYRLSDTVRVRGGVTYMRATFREGANAGNDVPLVSRWSGNAGITWDIWRKLATLDVNVRYFGERRMDNDQANTQPLIPAAATVDLKLGGHYQNFFWSAAVLNLFDKQYYDYAIASAFTPGYFTAYPQAGRTFMLSAGATF